MYNLNFKEKAACKDWYILRTNIHTNYPLYFFSPPFLDGKHTGMALENYLKMGLYLNKTVPPIKTTHSTSAFSFEKRKISAQDL